jgi:(1->4)-alpha-D-glucan 1-alpha-D-glucosylmutase
MTSPVSTYRLQFNKTFGLDDAAKIAGFLSDLGVTEIYASPILKSTPGSMHGYDICDHSLINPEIGGSEALQRLSETLKAHQMGLILDFVPNHMGINERENAWWRDVLENGPSSQHARFFDIDWTPLKGELRDKVLLPILGEQYGVALDAGKLQISLSDEGIFSLRYFDRDLPLNPRQLSMVLGHRLDKLKAEQPADSPELTEFLSVLFHLEHLPATDQTDMTSVSERNREKEVAKRRLASLISESPTIRAHVEANVQEFNGKPGEAASFDLLHKLLEGQPYRLSSWRTATHEINYRRFFDINELAAIRMEDSEVFNATHALTLKLIRDGVASGLRLDHVDGLFDPATYFSRLHEAGGSDNRLYVVVEKILSEGERLPEDWAVSGTTGYEFLNMVNSLFVDKSSAREFQKLYTRITGDRRPIKEVIYTSKKLIIETSMASEMHVLAHELNRISESDRHYRDFTLLSLQEALTEVVSCFPVYRTYVSFNGWSEFDKRTIDAAIRDAVRRNPAVESSIFRFIRKMLLPAVRPEISSEEQARRLRFAMKVQQYTGPVQAKGVEDTAFYRYCPLLSLNEVGGNLAQFGVRVEDFHKSNGERLLQHPLGMSASSTHDTKRGEDSRARLNILSEIPKLWSQQVTLWMRINSSARTRVHDEQAPDRSDEYIYYQALLGAWPAGEEQATPEFVERMRQYLSKATKEKKIHTSWITPSPEYDAAVAQFVERTLTGTRAKAFLAQFIPFQRRIAELGMVNSLSQLILKIASPGVPDFFQGSEVWDLNLVDPDNRRPVDFETHRQMLEDISGKLAKDSPNCAKLNLATELLGRWTDGAVKLFAMAQGLRLRKKYPKVFLEGDYAPLNSSGSVVAFARRFDDQAVVAVAPRLITNVSGFESGSGFPLGAIWKGTDLDLGEFAGYPFNNAFTGQKLEAENGRAPLEKLFAHFPVALLATGEDR